MIRRSVAWGFLLFLLAGPSGVGLAADDLALVQTAFLQEDFQKVVSATKTLLSEPASAHQDELLYLQGISALKLGDFELARASLKELVDRYPNSKRAAPAKKALEGEDFCFTIQVGAFGSRANALRVKTALDRRGYEPTVTEGFTEGRRLYRVRIGQFRSREEAEAQAKRLRADGFPTRIFP